MLGAFPTGGFELKRHRNDIGPWLVAVAVALLGGPSQAAEPRPLGQLSLSASLLYAYVVVDQTEPSGVGGSLALSYGLTESFALQGSGIWTTHTLQPTDDRDGGKLRLVSLSVGLAYALDLLAFTPVLEAGIGLLHRRLNGAGATDLGLLLGANAHYWILDWLGVGARLHFHAFLTDLSSFPIFVDLGPSVALRW